MSNLIGKSFGRYQILEQLGEGGMAIVYKAYDSVNHHEVAIKVIKGDGNDRIRKRFEREVEVLTRLKHPNIVSVLDYGEHENMLYLVMDHLPAGTLTQRHSGRLPWRKAVALVLPIAQALEYAHKKNIIHRDIKPSNILFDRDERAVLADFGIARIAGEGKTHELTGTKGVVGTPQYMSPEQGMGKKVDVRTDVYSLGVVLYELITGRRPFSGETPMEIVVNQTTQPLPTPSQYAEDIPSELEKILLTTLHKEPAGRFASMKELVIALEGLLQGRKAQTGKRLQLPKLEKSYSFAILGIVAAGVIGVVFWNQGSTGKQAVATTYVSSIQMTMNALETLVVSMSTPTEVVATSALQGAIELPVQEGTPIPLTNEAISIENVERLTMLARWGNGSLVDFEISKDGRYLYLGRSTGMQIVDVATMTGLRMIKTSDEVVAMAISKGGDLFATCEINTHAGTEKILIRALNDGAIIRTIDAIQGSYHVEFSSDDKFIIAATQDGITLWNVADGKLAGNVAGANPSFSVSGELLAITPSDAPIKVYRIPDLSQVRTIEWALGGYDFIFDKSDLLSPDGKFLVTSFEYLRLWNVENGTVHKFIEWEEAPRSIVFSYDSNILAVGSESGTIRFYQVSDGALIQTLKGEGIPIIMKFSPDGNYLFTGNSNGVLQNWQITDGRIVSVLESNFSNGVHLDISADNQRFFMGLKDGTGRQYNTSDGSFLQKTGNPILAVAPLNADPFNGNAEFINVLTSPDWKYMASIPVSSYEETGVPVWSMEKNSLITTLKGFSFLDTLLFSPDGEIIVTGERFAAVDFSGTNSFWGRIIFWDVESGTSIRTIENFSYPITFSPDGKTLASGGGVFDKSIRLWEFPEGNLLSIIDQPENATEGNYDFYALRYSPDGEILASGVGTKVRLWRVSDGTQIGSLNIPGDIGHLEFSTDGTILAVSSGGSVSLWNLSNGRLIQTLDRTSYDLAFTPDGRLLVIGLTNGTVELYGVVP